MQALGPRVLPDEVAPPLEHHGYPGLHVGGFLRRRRLPGRAGTFGPGRALQTLVDLLALVAVVRGAVELPVGRGAKVPTAPLQGLGRAAGGANELAPADVHADALAVELAPAQGHQADRGVRGLGAGVRDARLGRHPRAQLQLDPVGKRD